MTDSTINTAIVAVSGAITSMWRITVQCLAFATVAYFTYLSIASLAGKSTDASLVFKVLANVKFASTVSYGFGVGGLGYGYFQRRLRKSRIAKLAEYAKKLELKINPNRTSSNIRPDGTTQGEELL